MLDPKRDLKGATPETLAQALLKPLRRPRARAETVFGYQVPVEKGPPDKPRGRSPHLRKRARVPHVVLARELLDVAV